MWNGKITREETQRQLDEMILLGIKRIYILPMPKSFRPTSFPTPLEPEYLTEGYFDAYRYAVEQAKKRDMEVWLYDEGGWPSGGACGQVMLEDPSLVQEHVRILDREIQAGETYTPSEGAEAAFFERKRVLSGDVFKKSGALTEYIRVRTSFPSVSSADYPDVTKAGTTPLFLSLTHDRYAAALGEDLSYIPALFTDEPTAPRPFPYTDEIKGLFRERFHRDIECCLPFLMGREKCTEENAEIKVEFYRLLSDLFIERFLKKEKQWANARSLTFLGHLDKDDEADADVTSGTFGLLRALRAFDVPGVDAIRRQIFPPKGKRGLYGKNSFYPTLAASAAAQTGGRHALSESFAVYGAGLSYDEMRYIVNYQAMCGVNIFNLMIVPYARKGYALAGLLPHFTENSYPDLALFNRYLERLSYLFSLGERVARVALYYPAADVIVEGKESAAAASYEALGEKLQEKGVPFDIADDDFFTFATITKKGALRSCRAEYATVVLPSTKHIPEQTVDRLKRFVKAGGTLVCFSAALKDKFKDVEISEEPPASPFPIEEKRILVAESRTDDGEIFFLMNETGEEKTLLIPSRGSCLLLTPTDGKITRVSAGERITLVSGEIVCLLYSNTPLSAPSRRRTHKELVLTEWTIRPVKRSVMNKEWRAEPLLAEDRPTVLGDWKESLGRAFSGKAEYRTRFYLRKRMKNVILDLGTVKHAAEVLLNGISLGTLVMPPYRYEIPTYLLKEENVLIVRVENGVVNEFEGSEALDAYYPRQLGNYLKEERLFHADSMESGLFGKVKIHYN